MFFRGSRISILLSWYEKCFVCLLHVTPLIKRGIMLRLAFDTFRGAPNFLTGLLALFFTLILLSTNACISTDVQGQGQDTEELEELNAFLHDT